MAENGEPVARSGEAVAGSRWIESETGGIAGARGRRRASRIARPAWVLLAALLPALACGSPREPAGGARPSVLVSVAPEAYLVRTIAGERVRVRVLLRPGASPHAYEPSMADARLAAGAALYLAVGHPRLGFEAAWLSALESQGSGEGGAGLRIERLAEGCVAQPDDPHVWLSVLCYGLMARRAEAALRDLLPAAEGPALRAGLDSLLSTIARTASRADSILGPDRGRVFLVYHPAWGYLASEHDLEQVPVQSGSREPSPAELARVVARVRQEDLRVMFVQPGTSRGEARRVAAELGVETSSMDPLAEDWPAMYLDAVRSLDASWRR